MSNREGSAAWREILIFLILAAPLSAQVTPYRTAQIKDIHVPQIRPRPVIEQFLNGNSRPDMLGIDDFRQYLPGDGIPASRKTVAWIGYDAKTFYVVFVCESPPGETRARLSKRDDVSGDDTVEVYFDTYHDRQHAYRFDVNPLGVQSDRITTEGQKEDLTFDTLWYSDGRLTGDGFIAIIAVPFKSLRFSADEKQTWGFGLVRYIPSRNEVSCWPYITQKVAGWGQQLGTVSGLEGISPGRNLQLIPYATVAGSHFLDVPDFGTPGFRSTKEVRAGLDAKAVIHDSLTLDIALNPDFSQVESDDPQLTVNQRFEVFFPEKRPFFLENSGYFATPENLFFSRRIADPGLGARLTGKLGRWNLGLLGVNDRAPGAVTDPAAPAYGKHAGIAVVRVQREFGKQSNAGVLVTDREFAGSYNRVQAFNTRLKFAKNWSITGQAITSQTRRLDGTRSGGNAYDASLDQQSRAWSYHLQYVDRSEGFHTDLGFIPRVNLRQVQQKVKRTFHPKSKVLLSWGPRLDTTLDFDHRNVQQDWKVSPEFDIEFARSTNFWALSERTFERFNNLNFRQRITFVGGHSEYFRRATVECMYVWGTSINYATPAGRPAFLAQGSVLIFATTIRPTRRLKLDEIYYLTRFSTTPQSNAHSAIFVNHLARSRVNYQFTRELSMRLILDYNSVLPNPALTSLERQKRVSGDVLLTYLIHPGTALYIGYTDRLENLALTGGAAPGLERTAFPSTTTGRQFFAKISYLFRF